MPPCLVWNSTLRSADEAFLLETTRHDRRAAGDSPCEMVELLIIAGVSSTTKAGTRIKRVLLQALFCLPGKLTSFELI